MAIPLLEYAPSSQNQRVVSFEVAGEEQPRLYTTDHLPSASEMDALIKAAYRQIFNEQQMTSSNRQVGLESQLRAGQITVKEFIGGLATSDSFRARNYDVNNNYRFVQMCIQRILGRDVYSDREKLAWSIVLATKGLKGFIADLIHSEEYQAAFGDNTVPYQRRRILPQRVQGELPFARMARYGTDYRDKLPRPKLRGLGDRGFTGPMMSSTRWIWQKQTPDSLRRVGAGLIWGGVAFLALLFAATLLGF